MASLGARFGNTGPDPGLFHALNPCTKWVPLCSPSRSAHPTVRTALGEEMSGVKWIHLTKKHLSTESAVTLSSILRLSHNLSASVSLLENFE